MAQRDVNIGAKKYRPYLQLGFGIAYQYGVGNKVSLLDVAARRKLPIPTTLVLFETAYLDLLEIGLLRIEGEPGAQRLICANPDRMIAALNFPNFNWEFPAILAVRPAFALPDNLTANLTGRFDAQLAVDARDPAQLAAALCRVWESALGTDESLRRDLLLMKMITPLATGTATTAISQRSDQVHLLEAETAPLPAMAISMVIPQLSAGQQPSPAQAGWSTRLQLVLRELRAALARLGSAWEVEWADDGTTCYVLQIRPLEAESLRAALNDFLIQLPSIDSLPTPSRLAGSLASRCNQSIYELFLDLDRALPNNQPLVEAINGVPVLNLSVVDDIFCAWGLGSAEVTSLFGVTIDPVTPADPRRQFGKTLVLRRYRDKVRIAASKAQALVPQPESTLTTFQAVTEALQAHYSAYGQLFIAQRIVRESDWQPTLDKFAREAFPPVCSRLVALAEQATAQGQLPQPEAVWDLTLDELVKLDHGWKVEPTEWERRAAERQTWHDQPLDRTFRRDIAALI